MASTSLTLSPTQDTLFHFLSPWQLAWEAKLVNNQNSEGEGEELNSTGWLREGKDKRA